MKHFFADADLGLIGLLFFFVFIRDKKTALGRLLREPLPA